MQTIPFRRARFRRGSIALVAVGALVALTACSGESSTPEASASASDTSSAAASDAPTSLTLGVTRAPSTLDPIQLSAGTDSLIWRPIYDTMFMIGSEGELVPQMAESYEYNEDGSQLTLHLRDDLTFSTGEPATAGDFAATVEYVRDNPGGGQAMMANVESVEAPDDTTAVITFAQNDPGFLYDLTSRAGIIADPDLMMEESYGLNPIGAGPYVLDEAATQAGASYVLTKREDHWNAAAYPFEDVSVRVIADTTAAENALRTGEVDITSVTSQVLDQFGEPEFNVHPTSASSSIFLAIADRDGSIHPAFGDLRVRQAINMAFDRAGLVTALLQGNGQATQQMFFPNTQGYDEALNETYTYDVDAAQQLLADAGYPEGFEISMPSVVYTTTFEPAITQALADIGITVTWDPIPPQDTVSAVLSGTYPMIMWFASTLPAPNEVEDFYAPTALLNPLRSSDPELEALLAEANAVVDASEAGDIYDRINAWGVENAWFAPLFFTGENFVARDGYAYVGTDFQPSTRLESYGVEGS